MNSAKASGALAESSTPWGAKRSRKAGTRLIFATSCDKRVTISRAVPAGAAKPNQIVAS